MSATVRFRRCTVRLLALAAALLLPLSTLALRAEDDDGPEHEAEIDDLHFEPLSLEPAIFNFADPELARVGSLIAVGKASLQERRWWYRAAERYAPFEGVPAADWKLRAYQAGLAISHRASSTAAASTANSASSPIYNWVSLGPNGNYETQRMNGGPGALDQGRVTSLWTHMNGSQVVNKQAIFAGTADGGLWKSVDGGAHWEPLSDFMPSLAVGAFDVLPGSDLTNYGDATIYLGTGEGNFSQPDKDGVGVLKSTDGGRTWTIQPLPFRGDEVGIPGQHRMRRLKIDRGVAGGQSVWVAGDGGVYHTSNGGTSWQLVTGLPYTGAPATAAFPGGCWTEAASDFLIVPRPSQAPAFVAAFGRPNNAACAATGGVAQTANASRANNGIYRSLDGGATWSKLPFDLALPGGAPGDVGRITLLQAPSNPKHVYVLVSRTVDNKSGGIYATLDVTAPAVAWINGANDPTTEFTNGQGWYNLIGSVSPTDENRLIVGGLDNYLSTDGGATLSKISGWSAADETWSHADHHAAIWVDDTTYYDGNDGGIFVATIDGESVTWQNRNGGGLSTLQFYGLSQSATDPYKINAGLQDNGHALLSRGRWQATYGGDGGFAATDQRDDSQAYEEYVYGAIRHSDSAGDGWLDTGCMQTYGGCPGNCGTGTACNPDQHSAFIAHFTLDSGNQSVMYVGTNLIHKNLQADQAGKVWQPLAPVGTTAGDFVYGNNSSRAYVNMVHTPKANRTSGAPVPSSQILFAVTSTGRIWRSDDAGTTWRDLTKAPLPVTSTTAGRSLTWVDTDPANADHVVIVYSGWAASTAPAIAGHVFRSLDGGVTWTDVSGALPDEPFNTVAVNPNPGKNGQVFAGSDGGVYVNDDLWSNGSWSKINNGTLPNVSVNMLEFTNATNPKRLRAATHGRGIWELFELSQQSLKLDKASYACADTMHIELVSTDAGTGTQTVTVASAAEPAGESVTLLESPLGSGIFRGELRLAPAGASGDGRLTVWNADALSASWRGGVLQAYAVVDCSVCAGSAATGGNLRVESFSLSTQGGDGDEFLDNCEYGIVTLALRNVGAGPLTNVRVASVTSSNPSVRVRRLPVLAGSLPQCGTTFGTVRVEASGMQPGERVTLDVRLTADEMESNGVGRTLSVVYDPAEQDFARLATKTFSFEGGMDGWEAVAGSFLRSTANGGGAQLTGTYLASSSLTSGICDQVRSPVVKLTGTSTLTVYNQFSTEPMSDAWYDRANVGIYDVVTGSRATVVPSGGRPYLADGPNGVCATGGQPGWAGPGPGWLPSTWSAADLGAAVLAGKKVQLDVAYGTDASASLTGVQIDEVTLTDFDLQGADAQPDACSFCTPEIDDFDPGVEYVGGWFGFNDAGATTGRYHVREGVNPAGAVARVVFDGASITYLYALAKDGGTADLYLDGVKVATLSYLDPNGTSFGHAVTYANLGVGTHVFEVRHVSGSVYVDGFRFNCASGGGADGEAPQVRSTQTDSTARSTDGLVITRLVEVLPGDVGLSVLVRGLPAPVTVQLLGPLGNVVASGGVRVPGFSASGLDAGTLAPGTYTVRLANTLALGRTAQVSILRTYPSAH